MSMTQEVIETNPKPSDLWNKCQSDIPENDYLSLQGVSKDSQFESG